MQYSRDSLTFDVLEFGNKNQEVIVLLHGFPANAQSWQLTAELLEKRGYHVLVPKQRGYSEQARPKYRHDYRLGALVEDLKSLLDSNDIKSAHIVGHDWGGVVAWAFAAHHPERTLSLTAVSTPHPRALISSIFRSKQLFLSWYMLFFQLPWLPEFVVKKNIKRALIASGLSIETTVSYAEAMQDEALLKGALNWYRALPFTLFEARKLGRIIPKTLFIYGERDAFLSKTVASRTQRWVESGYKFIHLPHATHWIPEEMPKRLADEITSFISKQKNSEKDIGIGLKRGTVEVVPYSLEWPKLFQEEKSRLKAALGNTIHEIEHIGSTSIPELAAKPIIDMIASVDNLEVYKQLIKILEDLGYEFMPERVFKDRVFFPKGPRENRTHHLSLVLKGSAGWNNPIAFRDYLTLHKNVRKEYQELKQKLALQYPHDRAAYTTAKEGVIEKIMIRAAN